MSCGIKNSLQQGLFPRYTEKVDKTVDRCYTKAKDICEVQGMKKLLAVLLSAAMLVSLVACGETKKSGKRDDDDDEDETSYLD